MRTLHPNVPDEIVFGQAYCAMANVDPRSVIRIEVDETEVRFYTWEPLPPIDDGVMLTIEHVCEPCLIATMQMGDG